MLLETEVQLCGLEVKTGVVEDDANEGAIPALLQRRAIYQSST